MSKKFLVLALSLVLIGCESGGRLQEADVTVTYLTDQLGGCMTELLDQKGGSVVIKSPAQYVNFESELNALGEESELCASDVELPEVDFSKGIFVAENAGATCGLDYLELESTLKDNVLTVDFVQRELEEGEAICESFVEGPVAAQLTDLPEGANVVFTQ